MRYNMKENEKHLSFKRYVTLTSVIVLLLMMMFFIVDLESFVRAQESNLDQEEQFDSTKSDYADFANIEDVSDEIVMIEGSELERTKDLKELEEALAEEKTIVFLSLPTQDYIEKHELNEILGIRKIIGEKTQKELNLVSGFMLGGFYQFKKLTYDSFDLDLLFSTKVYAYGKKTKEKEYPIIWRNTYNKNEVYVVNGPFMETKAAYGIIAAILSEVHEDYIYPVINARLMTYEGFPYVSYKNKKQLEKNYNRDAMKLQHDILLPDLLSINKYRSFIPNGFFRLGFDEPKITEIKPNDQRQLTTYKEQIFNDGGEVGLQYSGNIEQDLQDYHRLFKDSTVKSIIINDETTDDELEEILEVAESVEVVVGPYQKDKNYQYINDQVVYLPFTATGVEQSAQDEFDFVAMVTAFGTITHNLDIEEIMDPADGKEKWTGAHKEYVQFLDNYRKRFDFIGDRTMTETADVLKTLINNAPEIEKSTNIITLTFPEWYGESDYILRTTKKVKQIKNGKIKKIEDNVYLITAKDKEVEIQVE